MLFFKVVEEDSYDEDEFEMKKKKTLAANSYKRVINSRADQSNRLLRKGKVTAEMRKKRKDSSRSSTSHDDDDDDDDDEDHSVKSYSSDDERRSFKRQKSSKPIVKTTTATRRRQPVPVVQRRPNPKTKSRRRKRSSDDDDDEDDDEEVVVVYKKNRGVSRKPPPTRPVRQQNKLGQGTKNTKYQEDDSTEDVSWNFHDPTQECAASKNCVKPTDAEVQWVSFWKVSLFFKM